MRIDFAEAAHYVSRAQIARVAIEAWVARNIDCWRCRSPLLPVPANTQLLDAICCGVHEHEIQVKSVRGVASNRLLGAAFAPMRARLGTLPDYLVVSYDDLRKIVVLAEFVDGSGLREEHVVARKPLAATARRHGWVGVTVNLEGLARRVVVGPSVNPDITQWPP